jgi:putative acetyltransferase
MIRPLELKDNNAVAKIIRGAFLDYDVPREGTVFTDPTTDNLFELFCAPKSVMLISEEGQTLQGCCGIYPTEGLPLGYAELVKFYVSKNCRGKGIGKALFLACIEKANQLGYTHLYIESFPEFKEAIAIYEQNGFKFIKEALGNSGHVACNVFMVREL